MNLTLTNQQLPAQKGYRLGDKALNLPPGSDKRTTEGAEDTEK